MNQKRGEEAFRLNELIKENESRRRVLLAQNAAFLSVMYQNKYYKELLGDEDAEWAGYLSDLDIYYSRNQVNTYIRLYDKLTNILEIDPSEWIQRPITRLADCLTFLTKENYEEWFEKASTLISLDWNKELAKAKGKEVDENHRHDMVNYEICRICGERHKI